MNPTHYNLLTCQQLHAKAFTKYLVKQKLINKDDQDIDYLSGSAIQPPTFLWVNADVLINQYPHLKDVFDIKVRKCIGVGVGRQRHYFFLAYEPDIKRLIKVLPKAELKALKPIVARAYPKLLNYNRLKAVPFHPPTDKHTNILTGWPLASSHFTKYITDHNIPGYNYFWINTVCIEKEEQDPTPPQTVFWQIPPWKSNKHIWQDNGDKLRDMCFQALSIDYEVKVGSAHFHLLTAEDIKKLMGLADLEMLVHLKPIIEQGFPSLLGKLQTYITFG